MHCCALREECIRDCITIDVACLMEPRTKALASTCMYAEVPSLAQVELLLVASRGRIRLHRSEDVTQSTG